MIEVTFIDSGEIVTASQHLYQWDKNQKLCIAGLNRLNNTSVHFTNKVMKEAIVVKGSIVDSLLVCDIPNILLEEKHDVIAYVYIVDESGSNTVRIINVKVKPRNKPSDYQFENNVEIMTFERLEADFLNFKTESTASFMNFKAEAQTTLQECRDATNALQLEKLNMDGGFPNTNVESYDLDFNGGYPTSSGGIG